MKKKTKAIWKLFWEYTIAGTLTIVMTGLILLGVVKLLQLNVVLGLITTVLLITTLFFTGLWLYCEEKYDKTKNKKK